MELTAIFESWHLGDGTYPPLTKGMLVNLSFEMQIREIGTAVGESEKLAHLGGAQYDFTAKVIRRYEAEPGAAVAVFEAGSFRFYACRTPIEQLVVGDLVSGTGRLQLDHYL